MKIVVCVKYVPDTATKVRIAESGKQVDYTDVSFVVNPYDEFAVEEALRLKEQAGGEVVVVSAGSQQVASGLRTCLAMGADSAVLIQSDRLEDADSFAVGSALAKVCTGLNPDIVLFGKHAIGVDNGQVPAVVAELLDFPQVSTVIELQVEDGKFRAKREIEGAREVIEGTLPAVVTAQKGLNEPRYASLKGIMAAKKKKTEIVSLDALGLSDEDLATRRIVQEVGLPPPRKGGKILTGEVSETVPELVRLLHEEAKII